MEWKPQRRSEKWLTKQSLIIIGLSANAFEDDQKKALRSRNGRLPDQALALGGAGKQIGAVLQEVEASGKVRLLTVHGPQQTSLNFRDCF